MLQRDKESGRFLRTAVCGTPAQYRRHGCRCDACRQAIAVEQREWRRTHNATYRVMSRRDRLQRQYGLTVAEFDMMYQAQNGCCAICEKHENVCGQLQVDHCHASERVRGLLCKSCNTKLGWYENRPEKIAEYLKKGVQ